MRVAYSFSVLRYVHDPVTQEFLNVGVAVYSNESRFLRAMCATNYERVTRVFTRIDGNQFRSIVRFIQDRINRLGQQLSSELRFDNRQTIAVLLGTVLPQDDSALQFSEVGVGLSDDLDATLVEIFERYVEQYSKESSARREDEDVWRVFREPMERRQVAEKLVRKRIAAKNYDYEFDHSWKNQRWHVCEPVSLDLLQPGSILEKANRWVGRAMSLADSDEDFEIHLLLGEPRDTSLRSTFVKAQNILNKMPGRKELVREAEAESFAEEVARQIKAHS